MIRGLRRAAKGLASAVLGGLLALWGRREVPEKILKVLVIRVDLRVGNVLLTTPLIRALQVGLPDAQVSVLVAPSKASLLEGIAPTLIFDKKAVRRHPWAFLGQLRRLRRERFDVVIDASHWHTFSVTSAALLAWTGAPIRIAHDRGAAARFANRRVAGPSAPEWEIRTKLRLLEPLGIEPGRPELITALGQGPARDRMQAWLQSRGGPGPGWVGLAPGARKLDHRASPELFIALGAHAQALGWSVVVLWGPGEEGLAEQVAVGCGAVVAPPTSLDELAALMRACGLVVANDTGPMHLCVACQTRCLALFKGADPTRWGHEALGHTVLVVGEADSEHERSAAIEALDRGLGVGLASS